MTHLTLSPGSINVRTAGVVFHAGARRAGAEDEGIPGSKSETPETATWINKSRLAQIRDFNTASTGIRVKRMQRVSELIYTHRRNLISTQFCASRLAQIRDFKAASTGIRVKWIQRVVEVIYTHPGNSISSRFHVLRLAQIRDSNAASTGIGVVHLPPFQR